MLHLDLRLSFSLCSRPAMPSRDDLTPMQQELYDRFIIAGAYERKRHLNGLPAIGEQDIECSEQDLIVVLNALPALPFLEGIEVRSRPYHDAYFVPSIRKIKNRNILLPLPFKLHEILAAIYGTFGQVPFYFDQLQRDILETESSMEWMKRIFGESSEDRESS